MVGMAKRKMTVTLDPDVLAQIDSDANTDGLNRSEYVERALRNEHYRRLLSRVEPARSLSSADERRLRGVLAWHGNPAAPAPAP
jgi:hypothetical protein